MDFYTFIVSFFFNTFAGEFSLDFRYFYGIFVGIAGILEKPKHITNRKEYHKELLALDRLWMVSLVL